MDITYNIGDKVVMTQENEYFAIGQTCEIVEIDESDDTYQLKGETIGGGVNSFWMNGEKFTLHVPTKKVKPTKRKPLVLKEFTPTSKNVDDFKFGVELECLLPHASRDLWLNSAVVRNAGFVNGTDSSINTMGGTDGIEIRSAGATTYDKLKLGIAELCKEAYQHDLSVNSSCGFHLHISHPKFFDKDFLRKLVFFWASIEDFLLSTQPSSRLNNDYCKRFLAQYIQDEQHGRTLPEGKSELIGELSRRSNEGSSQRRKSLNLMALAKHGTIEVRLHSGTLNQRKIQAWIDLMVAIFDYCLNSYKHTEILALFDNEISENKIKKIYELLTLDEELTAYLDTRIRKLTFKKLAAQQESARRIAKDMKTFRTTAKKLEKVTQEHARVANALSVEMRNIES